MLKISDFQKNFRFSEHFQIFGKKTMTFRENPQIVTQGTCDCETFDHSEKNIKYTMTIENNNINNYFVTFE